jgi:hypothetical protein
MIETRRYRFSLIVAFCTLINLSYADEAASVFPPPSGAVNVMNHTFNDGGAHQTDFVMHAKYPASPAYQHYSNAVGRTWQTCAGWGGDKWERYLDGSHGPLKTVHQQLHMWVNAASRRTLVLGVRYLSSDNCGDDPESDEQHVVLVEYLDQDVPAIMKLYGVQCPPNR